jgi:hypothetical protein
MKEPTQNMTERPERTARDVVLSGDLVQDAIAYLNGRIRRTPVEFSPALTAIATSHRA